MTRILTLVGSLRAASTNLKLAELAAELAPPGVEIDRYDDLAAIPFYNEDLDGDQAPEAAVRLRDAIAAADALLIVSPTYNHGVPAHIKNAIDWGSRPSGNAALAGKPVAAIGTAWGPSGGAFAHEAIRTSAKIAGAIPLEDVILALPDSLGRFGGEAHPRDDEDVVRQVRAAVEAVAAATAIPAPA